MDPEALATALSVPHSPLCRIKTNAMPLILSGAHPAVQRIVPANVLPDVPDHIRRVRSEPGFFDRLIAASSMARQVYPDAEHVEDQLYEGGFFPAAADQRRFATFHAAAAREKIGIARTLEDQRARQLAARIVYNEWPRELPADEYARSPGRRARPRAEPRAGPRGSPRDFAAATD
jgi:exonuclease I